MSRSHKCRGWTMRSHWSCARCPALTRPRCSSPRGTRLPAWLPGAAVQQTTTMRRVLDTAIGPARQVVMLLSLMTALSLILGAIGVYGVIAHYAARRRRDWAIRVALGLPGSRVISHVVGHGSATRHGRDRRRCRRRGDAHATAVVISLWRERDRPHRVCHRRERRCSPSGQSQPFFRRGARGWLTL